VTATSGHKFYSPDKGWITAGNLKPGDKLRDTNGNTVTVRKTYEHTAKATVHNLTVNNTHTYYVIAGTTPVLVHNCGTGETPTTLRHYTNEDGMNGIVDSNELRASTKAASPKDALWGWPVLERYPTRDYDPRSAFAKLSRASVQR
jgi:hypothetical protein